MNYKFTYRRRWWTLSKSFVVAGHRLEPTQDKMVLFFPNGGVREIAEWSRCEIRLGTDWVVAQQKALEKQAGQPIPLAVTPN